eukprot:TRINITY_DN9458_c0_g2_i1.p1 TRINITY_DN9458_c0_g2~~TRINITY_DN9458_c0_g2_i1.p1  ORF type:complete len:232 (+),score=31.08 TRINITY_DN9458_c0_g2_i1:216-911(+)
MLGDFCIPVDIRSENNEYGGLAVYTFLRPIIKVEHNEKERTVEFFFGSLQVMTTDWRYVVERLEAAGDRELKLLADGIVKYYNLFSYISEKMLGMNDSRNNTNVPAHKPALALRFSPKATDKEKDIGTSSIIMTEHLVYHLGYTVEGLIMESKSKGLPSVFSKGSNALKSLLNIIKGFTEWNNSTGMEKNQQYESEYQFETKCKHRKEVKLTTCLKKDFAYTLEITPAKSS